MARMQAQESFHVKALHVSLGIQCASKLSSSTRQSRGYPGYQPFRIRRLGNSTAPHIRGRGRSRANQENTPSRYENHNNDQGDFFHHFLSFVAADPIRIPFSKKNCCGPHHDTAGNMCRGRDLFA
jgi:hypothetical protein